MSTNYEINFSEPLKQGFTISAGGRNGPGDANADSSLRLYGRNALDWGEAVNEDLLRLVENFASASPPGNAITGQLWAEWSLYYKDTTAVDVGSVSFGWWRWNVTTAAWEALPRDANIGTDPADGIPKVEPVQISEGSYWVDGATLRGGYSLGKYEPIAWVSRSYVSGSGNPPASLKPPVTIRIFDEAAGGVWATPSTTATSTTEPNPAYVGMFWYNPDTGVLKLRTSTAAWHDVLGPSLTTAPVSAGPVDMGGNQIKNLADPTDDQDAVTRNYFLTTVDAGFLPLAGGTITGNLNVNGTLAAGGGIDMVGTGGIDNIIDRGSFGAYGQWEAVPKQHVESEIGAIVTTALANSNAAVVYTDTNPGTSYKAGDIYIRGGRIFIAAGPGAGAPELPPSLPGGAWRQVYPAVYA